ncbi:hypothetical protein DFA_09808 [Cavenderia fasciculata]|uniref:Calcineurin-like phosphoesterase domain-containing protein n=1 Tax=Cavenderia fasciculata TaxID=261658 RepID=F4QAS0_CACFS|nr:uncharacterized protein DFA_09808 [Cavenderia fasciculata]EGG14988.1 hypothetical protein DFA_09808 [Cavenderia fasciculata]|eukprot:XP_004351708.1 hypothetical protein DFA_09808 [Cavenderia fasciculata]
MKVYAVSDIHTDFPTNYEYMSTLPKQEEGSVLIISGDISDQLSIIEKTLKMLKEKYTHIFYTFGNHELWIGRDDNKKYNDSIEKWNALEQLCKQLGVYTTPTRLNNKLAIVPLVGWYHPSFDEQFELMSVSEKEETYAGLAKVWGDFKYCKWNFQSIDAAQFFLNINDQRIKEFKETHKSNYPENVITFSHFVPRRELLPPREKLIRKHLPLVVGCLQLDDQLRSINSNTHIFGHTHIDYDVKIDGVRYVQNAFSAPQERVGWKKPYITEPYRPVLVYSD